MKDYLAVGRITRAHGVRGEVSVQPLTEVESRFAPGSVLYLEDGRTLTVGSSRPHRHRVLVTFEQVPHRTAAEELRGQVLLVSAADTPTTLEEGRFWVHQVVGLEVVTDEGRALGPIREVLANPANDLWVVDADPEPLYLPALRDLVVEVDLEGRRVVVREVPGLTAQD